MKVTACFSFSVVMNFLIAADGLAQANGRATLLALSKADHVLAIIDPVTGKITARVPVGADPHEVIASADGKTAYVSNYGGGSQYDLNIIDLVGQKPATTVDTRPLIGLHGLTFATGKVWFTAEGSKAIGSYDPAAAKVDWCMGTGQDRTHMIFVSPNGKQIYTTNVSSGTVSILVDTLLPPRMPPPGGKGFPGGPPDGGAGKNFPPPKPRMEWIQTVVPVGKGSEGFDVSPDGTELWTAAAEDGSIAIIDIPGRKVATTIDAKVFGANRLKFTPDGKQVLVTSLGSGDLVVYDAKSRKELKKIPIGHGAAGILIDPDGSRAFIGCTPDDYVAVINLKTMEVSGHIALGGPDGLAWSVRP